MRAKTSSHLPVTIGLRNPESPCSHERTPISSTIPIKLVLSVVPNSEMTIALCIARAPEALLAVVPAQAGNTA